MKARIRRLRERVQTLSDEALFYERLALLEEAYREYGSEASGRRYALAFGHVLDHLTVEIHSDELIVGSVKEIVPSEAEESAFLREGRHHDFSAAELFTFDPLRLATIREIQPRYAPAWFHSWGHLTISWRALLTKGVGGVAAYARKALECEVAGSEAAARRGFYENVIIVASAIERLANRYAEEALRLAAAEKDVQRRGELERIAVRCRRVPAGPAHTFTEALQSIWFYYMILQCVCGARDYGLGLFDRYLADLCDAEEGVDRLEWLECFFLKLNEIIGVGVESFSPKRTLSVNSLQYLVLGGQDQNGRDVSNALSSLVLDAVNELELKQPTVVVRVHEKLDQAFLNKACGLAQKGLGYPAFFNDATVIPALVGLGVSRADAVEYVHYGCNNVNVQGKEDELREVWHALPKYLEFALNEGRCLLTGELLGAVTRPITELSRFEDVLEALRVQMRYGVRLAAERIRESDRTWASLKPFSVESMFVDECVARGVDLTAGGCVYRHANNYAVGIATAANALCAIKRVVFQQRELSLEELRHILEANFEGNEQLRRHLAEQVPKFGNDNEEVDGIAREVADLWVSETNALPASVSGGRRLWPAFYSLWHHRELGRHTAATADGRLAGEPLSESQSPVYDSERLGPTAALNSIAKLPFVSTPSGGLNIKLQSSMLRRTGGVDILRGIILGYFRSGGMELQINVLDRATLLDARSHPEGHRNLLVRVVGYSAYFVTLSPEQQDEIIARTEYSMPA